MEEKKILLKTIEALNATISSLSSTNQRQAEQLRSLQERVKELTAQVTWLNRQLFGRKSEKLAPFDPNQLDLFSGQVPENALEIKQAHDIAVESVKETAEDRAVRIVRRSFSLSVSNFVSLDGSPAAAREAFSLSSAACPFRFAQYSRSVMQFLLPCNKSI